MLRGGAFKPRSSPYAYPGPGTEGLEALRVARAETGLPVVTECLDPREVEVVAEVADILQIGARSMQNFPLLREAGRAGKPVLLKRGLGATLEEWLLAAEHVLIAGEERVILCERGVRGVSSHSRFTLDLSILPRLRELTHLPVWVDPSHATGRASSVPSMALAAIAAGADGLLIECHPEPALALSDGLQALEPAELRDLLSRLRAVAEAVGRQLP
jgi:3-deoxy-7-phosphoheptulonate synthase